MVCLGLYSTVVCTCYHVENVHSSQDSSAAIMKAKSNYCRKTPQLQHFWVNDGRTRGLWIHIFQISKYSIYSPIIVQHRHKANQRTEPELMLFWQSLHWLIRYTYIQHRSFYSIFINHHQSSWIIWDSSANQFFFHINHCHPVSDSSMALLKILSHARSFGLTGLAGLVPPGLMEWPSRMGTWMKFPCYSCKWKGL